MLSTLNKQLIDDENSNNTMNIDQLKVRMEDFRNTTYKAFLFIENDTVYGYALLFCKMNRNDKLIILSY